jgi:hypothetical protein
MIKFFRHIKQKLLAENPPPTPPRRGAMRALIRYFGYIDEPFPSWEEPARRRRGQRGG